MGAGVSVGTLEGGSEAGGVGAAVDGESVGRTTCAHVSKSAKFSHSNGGVCPGNGIVTRSPESGHASESKFSTALFAT